MVNQAFFLDPNSTGGADRYGIGANGVQEYFALLRQFSGEELSSQGRYATEGSTRQYKSIGGRISAVRQGIRTSGMNFNLDGVDLLAVNGQGSHLPGQALIGGTAGEAAATGWAWFGNVEYEFGERDQTDFENGYDSDGFGVTIGIDYALDNGVVLGGAFEFNSANVDFDQENQGALSAVSGGEQEFDSQSISGFVSYNSGSFFASGIISYAEGEIDMEREIDVVVSTNTAAARQTLDSDTDTEQFGLQAQVGYTFGEGALSFDVYGGFDLMQLDIDSFSETGSAVALAFGDQDIDSEQIFLGGTLRNAITTDSGVIIPYLTVEVRNELDNDERSLDARYAFSALNAGEIVTGGPIQGDDDNFSIPTDDPDDTYFDVTVGISAQFANDLFVFLQYGTVLGLDDTDASVATLGLRGTF